MCYFKVGIACRAIILVTSSDIRKRDSCSVFGNKETKAQQVRRNTFQNLLSQTQHIFLKKIITSPNNETAYSPFVTQNGNYDQYFSNVDSYKTLF